MFSFSSSSAPSLSTPGAGAGISPAAGSASSVPSFSSSFPAATTAAPAAPAAATGTPPTAPPATPAAAGPGAAAREQERDAHSEAELQTILSLMRRRASADIPPVEVFRDTNALLNANLLSSLLREIERDVKSVQTSPSSCIPTAANSNNSSNNSNNDSNSNTNSSSTGGIQWEKLRVKAEIVFFALYQTQATQHEAAQLLSLVELVSDVVATANIDFFFSTPTTAPNAASSASSTAAAAANVNANAPAPAPLDSEAFQAAQQELAKPLLLLLVILQLAHCAAHQQTVALYSREREYASEREVAQFAEENSLSNPPGEKFALDRRAWRCRGAQAMACLVYAVFRQPEVDEGRAPPQDVQWFLHEAAVLRGYSYLRLVVLPVVQWLRTVDEETSLFYFSIVADLLENLSEIYCMSCYRSPERERERDRESSWEREQEESALWTAAWEEFPRAFFAPTHEYYETHIEDYQPHSESLSHTDTERDTHTQAHTQSARKRWSPLVLRSLSSSSSSLSLGPLSSSPTHAAAHTHAQASLVLEDGVDTLQEVISLHCDFMQCYPAFATLFWKEDKEKEPLDGLEREPSVRSPLRRDFSVLSSAGKGANASVNMSERKRRGERETAEKEREISVYTAHHFVTRLLAVCPAHASLWIPALQYLTALAESNAETARAVFFFLRSAESSPFHWRSLLRGVNTVAAHFTDARSLVVSAPAVSGAESSAAAAAKREGEVASALSAWDVPALHAVLDLFSAVARERDIALELCSTHSTQANVNTNINTSINMNTSSASLYATNASNLGFGGNTAGAVAELSVLACLVEVFSLSFPVEIKAAAVRCLAQLAAQDVSIARQVLVLFEGFADDRNSNNNTTPQSLVPLASQAQTLTHAQSSQSALALSTKAVLYHFRQELEQRESVLGFYPLSEALLSLLQSLFSHGEQVQEGVGFKEPGGLLPYIDYTVHDLLLTTHQRPFSLQSPAVSAPGREGVAGVGMMSGASGAERERERERDGARWRLCSRALAVLVTVLDRFPVAPSQTQTETEKNPQTHTTYTPEELAARREKERARLCAQCETSLGFYTLSLVLSHSRLTELLSQIVRGVNRDFLAHTLARNMQRELQSVVHALLFFTPHSALPQHLTPLTQRAHTPSARLLSLLQSLSHAAPLSHTLTTPSHNIDRPFYLLHAKRENTINSLVWIERAIALCVSVVWHVARCERDYRERALSLFPRGDVCVWRFQGTRVTRVPCVPLTLSVWLAGDALTPCLLSLMAHNFRTQPTLPSVRVLVVQIVEYLAVCEAVQSNQSLSVEAPSVFVTGSGVRSSQQQVCALDALLVDDSVVETFSRALLGVPPSAQHAALSNNGVSLSQSSSALSGSGEYVAMHSGGERRPFAVCARGLRGESGSGERGSVSERCVETLRGSFSLSHNSGSGVCEEDEAQTLRQAVLSLLLGTLSTQRSPTTRTAHSYSGFLLQLLGLSPEQQPLSSSVKRQDCLDALLRLVHPVHGGVFSLSPSLSVSVDVYELLYRLVSSSVTESALAERNRQREVRRALLRRLRAPEVDFFATHLAFLLRLCECDVADVRQLCGLTQHSQTEMNARDVLCESVVLCEWAFSVRQALSWLLKIVECELVECRAQPHSVTHTQSAQSILSLLLDGAHTTHNTAQEAQIPLTRVLSVAAWETQTLCAHLLRRRVSPSLSPFVRDCLRYTRSVRAGSSIFFSSSLSSGLREEDIVREPERERLDDELPLTASPQYAYIDCRRLTQHLLTHRAFAGLSLDEKEELLFTAVEENVRNKLDAAASHLTLTWRSLTDYLCLSSYLIRTTIAPLAQASYLHPRTQESVRALARLVFAGVCVSATETLALALREKQVFVKEQLARSLLSTLSLCERLQEEYDVDCMEMVSEEHWQRVCELCVSVVRASSEVGELSFTLQGYCAAALEMMLRIARRAAQAHTEAQEETGDGVGVWMLNSFALVTRKHIRELSESLSRLAVKAHLAWRLVALSLLSSLFRLCVERESNGEGAGRRVLSILTLSLSQKGLLDDLATALQRQFWVSLSPSVSSVSLTTQLSARERAGAATSGSSEEDGLELLDSTLQFFSVLAETSEGRDGLVKTGLLDLLADLTVFRRYPVTNESATNGNSNKYNNNLTSASLVSSSSSQSSSSSSSSMCVSFRKAFSSTLQFFSLFLSLSDARLDVLSGIASFLRKNHSTCSHVLRVRDLSFAGLQLAELVSHCLVCFASRCATLPEQGQSGTSEGGYARLVRWLGDDVDALLLDCLAAIELLDLNPILAILPNAALQSTFSATMRLSWFASISLPSHATASAAQIARFESDKVFAALSALTNVVAFVRLATISGSQQTQQAGDKCVPSMLRLSLLRGLSAVFAQAVDMLNLVKNSSAVAVKGDSVVVLVHKDLHVLLENTISALYNLSTSSADAQTKRDVLSSGVRTVLQLAQQLPDQCFAKTVAKWLEDKLRV